MGELARCVVDQSLKVHTAMHIEFMTDAGAYGGSELAEDGALCRCELGCRLVG